MRRVGVAFLQESSGRFPLLSLLLGQRVWAQRGVSQSSSIEPAESPSQGFPGFFDSYLAPEGKVALDLPTFILILPTPISSVDYGLSKTTTVGTNPSICLVAFYLKDTPPTSS